MPTVPTTPRELAFSGPQVSPTYLLMAAATMHEQGRLFEPQEPRNEMDYSILENKTGKEFSDTIKWFDDFVKDKPELQRGWEDRRKREIEQHRPDNELPTPRSKPISTGIA